MIGSAAHEFDDHAVIDGRADVVRKLESIDFSDALERVGDIVALGSIDRIKTLKTDPSGAAWAPWSSSYARSGRGDSLLDQSGSLAASIDSFVSGSDEVTIYAERPYAARQQWGFRGRDSLGRNVNHPAREYLGVSDRDLVNIADELANFVGEALS